MLHNSDITQELVVALLLSAKTKQIKERYARLILITQCGLQMLVTSEILLEHFEHPFWKEIQKLYTKLFTYNFLQNEGRHFSNQAVPNRSKFSKRVLHQHYFIHIIIYVKDCIKLRVKNDKNHFTIVQYWELKCLYIFLDCCFNKLL